MRVSVKKKKEYPPLEQGVDVAIYNNPRQIPIEHEKLGKIEIVCINLSSKKDDTTRCKSDTIFRLAESKAKEIGGNALQVKFYKEPTIWWPHFRLCADILKVSDFSSPTAQSVSHISRNYGKGTWDLRLSIPYINHFMLKPEVERNVSSAGFWGIAVGFDYYHQNTQYLSIVSGAAINYALPVLVGVDYFYGEEVIEREICSSVFMGLTNNQRYKSFSFGYGLSYLHNSWKLIYEGGYDTNGDYVNIPPPDKKYTNNTLGLMFTSYWLTKKSFSLGIIYLPSFIRLNTNPTFKYEHVISIDLAWRIRLKTVKYKPLKRI